MIVKTTIKILLIIYNINIVQRIKCNQLILQHANKLQYYLKFKNIIEKIMSQIFFVRPNIFCPKLKGLPHVSWA